MYGRGHSRGTRQQRPQSSVWYAQIEAETLAGLEEPAREAHACELCPDRPGQPFLWRVDSQRQGTDTRLHYFCGPCAAETRQMCTGKAAEWALSVDLGFPVRVFKTPEGIHSVLHDGVSSVGKRLRFLVFKRDGYRCQLCGATAQDEVRLVADHKIAKAYGGPTTYENLWTLCEPCNQGKGALPL